MLRRQNTFEVRSLHGSQDEMMSALYLQVSIISQTLIFVTRSGWCFTEMHGLLLCAAFVVTQIVSQPSLLPAAEPSSIHDPSLTSVATIRFAHIRGVGWCWAGAIWTYNAATFLPLEVFKLGIWYALRAQDLHQVTN